MLVIDAFLTILTWMPEEIFYLMVLGGFRLQDMKKHLIVVIVLQGLSLTNVFSTSIVYYLFNNKFKVSKDDF